MASEDAILMGSFRDPNARSVEPATFDSSIDEVQSNESLDDLRSRYDELLESSPVVEPEPEESESGFTNQLLGSLERTVAVDNPRLGGRAIEGLGRVTGIESMQEFGEKIVREFDQSDNPDEFVPTVSTYKDVDGLQSFLDYAGSTLGQGLGSLGVVVGGGAAGAAAGSAIPGAGTAAGAVAGATGSGFLLNYGDTYEYLVEQEGMDPNDAAPYALIPAAAMAVLDTAGVGFVLKPVKDTLKKNLVKRTAQLALRGAGSESLTETAQQVIQESAGEMAEALGLAKNDIVASQRFENIANAFFGSLLPGGVFGAASAPLQRPVDKPDDTPPVVPEQVVDAEPIAEPEVAPLPVVESEPVRVTAALTGVQDARDDMKALKKQFLEESRAIVEAEKRGDNAEPLRKAVETIENKIFADFEAGLRSLLERDGDIEIVSFERGLGGWAGQELEPNLRIEVSGDKDTVLSRITEFNQTSGMSGPKAVPQGGALNRISIETIQDKPDVIDFYDAANVEENKKLVWDDNGAERLATLQIDLPAEMLTPESLASLGSVFAKRSLGFTVDRKNNRIELIHTPEWSRTNAQDTLSAFVEASRNLQEIARQNYGSEVSFRWIKEQIEISAPESDVINIKNSFSDGDSAYRVVGYTELRKDVKDEYRGEDSGTVRDRSGSEGQEAGSDTGDSGRTDAGESGVSVEAIDDATQDARAEQEGLAESPGDAATPATGDEPLFAPSTRRQREIWYQPDLHPKPDDLIVVEHKTDRKYLDQFMDEGIDATIEPPRSGLGRLTIQPDGSVRQVSIKEPGLYVAGPNSLVADERVVIVTPAKNIERSIEAEGLGYESGLSGLYGAGDAIIRTKIPPENVAGKFIYDGKEKEWKWIGNPKSPYANRFEADGRVSLITKPATPVADPDPLLEQRIEEATEAGSKTKKEAREAARLWKEKGIDSKYFKRWFGKSILVDSKGNPVRLFHGTDRVFDVFSEPEAPGLFGQGIYTTFLPYVADEYTSKFSSTEQDSSLRPNIIPGYVSIQNPIFTKEPADPALIEEAKTIAASFSRKLYLPKGDLTTFDDLLLALDDVAPDRRRYTNSQRKLRLKMEKLGYDGMINASKESFEKAQKMDFKNTSVFDDIPRDMHVILLKSSQFKSDIGNLGTFDPLDPRIQYGLTGAAIPAAAALQDSDDDEGEGEGNPLAEDFEGPFIYNETRDYSGVSEMVNTMRDAQSRYEDLLSEINIIEAEYTSLSQEDRDGDRGRLLEEWHDKTLDEYSNIGDFIDESAYTRFLMGSDVYFDTEPTDIRGFDERRGFNQVGLTDEPMTMDISTRRKQENEQRFKLQKTIENGGPYVDFFGKLGDLNKYLYKKASFFQEPVQTVQLNGHEKRMLYSDEVNLKQLYDSGLISYLLYRELVGDVELL